MKTHILRQSMRSTRPREEVFAFFADASNLERITPPEVKFKILTPGPLVMRPGLHIDYQLRLAGMKFSWETLISEWSPPHHFVDEQLRGPYASWVHTHTFVADPSGTIIEDEVRWRLPLYPFGEVAYPVVNAQLRRIFSYREKTIRALLG